MIIFYHGYGSSNQTNKFTELESAEKYCRTVDYDKQNYEEIEALYSADIEREDPEMLVGHSLGGYWAVKMSKKYGLPIVLINPALLPEQTRPELNYRNISHAADLLNDISVYAYIESGDEIIPVPKTIKLLQDISYMEIHQGGHHRVERMDNVNKMVNYAVNTHFLDQCNDL